MVDPKQMLDFIALRGDPFDKLPGAPGVGPKRAAELLRRYGRLEGVLKASLLRPIRHLACGSVLLSHLLSASIKKLRDGKAKCNARRPGTGCALDCVCAQH
jgi:5'-3' exonuclease